MKFHLLPNLITIEHRSRHIVLSFGLKSLICVWGSFENLLRYLWNAIRFLFLLNLFFITS